MCTCDYDPYEDSDEESWHFKRTCEACGHVWYGLHCIHDGYQNPCSNCGTVPTPEQDEEES